MKRIVKGNDFTLRIPVAKVVEGEKVAFPLPACTDVVVRIANQYKRVSLDFSIDTAEDNVILAKVEGDQISLGTYAVEVRGKIFGNDWRSNEYPQFQIVGNNADADTEFGTTDEGDDSVEMDTALVVLPPTAELSQLISDTNEALKTAKATDETLAANEAARQAAETSRVEAEQARATAETSRSESETLRKEAETSRQSAETDRTNAEALRVSQESTRAEMEAERKSSETERRESEATRNDNEAIRMTNEANRIANENARKEAETSRQASEKERQEAETARKETISDALTDFTSHQTAFDNAEQERVSAEQARTTAENKRATAEQSRSDNEAIREKNETARKSNESDRQTAETARAASFSSLSSDMKTAADNAQKAADATSSTNTAVKAEEEKRALAEASRTTAEKQRATEEGIRQEAETERIRQETARQSAETSRTEAEEARASAEASRESTLAKTKADCETATKAATDAATEATLAKTKAEEAATGAENVDATIDGSTVKITNRKGEVSTYELEEWAGDETCEVTLTTKAAGVDVSGLVLNVYVNGATIAEKYTTDASGKASFIVKHGSYYKIEYPQLANCDAIPSATYVAVLKSRSVSVEYKEYTEEDKMEPVTIIVRKYSDADIYAAFPDVPISVKIGTADAETMTTDTDGKITFKVARGTSFTVTADKYDGYYVHNNMYSHTYTAEESYRYIHYNYHAFRTGVFIVHSDGSKYTSDEWTEKGFIQSEAVGVSVVTAELVQRDTVFTLDIGALHSWSYPSKQWCEQSVQFYDITLNGNSATDNPNYYDGKTESELVLQEAEERTLTCPAFEYAKSQTLTVGGATLGGFLGSVGQHYILWNNRSLVDECLTAVFGDSVDVSTKMANNRRWTSTQKYATNSWYFYSSPDNSSFKSDSCLAVPFYAC